MQNSELLASPPRVKTVRKRGILAAANKYGPIYVFLIPTFLLLAVFTFYPIVSAFWHSFYRWDGINSQFVGIENFVQMFTADRAFLASLPNVALLTIFRLVVAMTIPLLAAEVIFSLRSGAVAYFWRVLLVVP